MVLALCGHIHMRPTISFYRMQKEARPDSLIINFTVLLLFAEGHKTGNLF